MTLYRDIYDDFRRFAGPDLDQPQQPDEGPCEVCDGTGFRDDGSAKEVCGCCGGSGYHGLENGAPAEAENAEAESHGA